jgi:hypothetical protein
VQSRRLNALVLVLLTACASAPRPVPESAELYEAELEAIRYELKVLTVGAVRTEPVKVSAADFRKALRERAREVRAPAQPEEAARYLLEEELQAELVAEVERGRVVRMVPMEEDSPLSAVSNAALVAWYQSFCAERHGGGDCLGLVADGPVLDRADRRTLALAYAFDSLLPETREALGEMVSPQALMAMVVWSAGLYFMLWLVPEPVTKGVALLLTLGFIAWLGVDTVWSLMDGWARLVHDADRATTPEELREAGRKFAQVMGQNTARVVVLLVTAAVGGGAARFSQKLPKLPGFERAAAQAEAQGVRLAAAGEVEAVAFPAEGTLTLMVRSPGSRAAAVAAETRAGVSIIIRHQGGNRQVLYNNNQRWHVPANRSVKEIPKADPVGDALVVAARREARRWSHNELTEPQRAAIDKAREGGKYFEATLMERMFRGQWVERQLRGQFTRLRWNPKGVDAVDPVTGYRYEVLSGTASNMELHGRRMAEEFFRLITF